MLRVLPTSVRAAVTATGAGAGIGRTCDDDRRIGGARAHVAAPADRRRAVPPAVAPGPPAGFSGDRLRADLRYGPTRLVLRIPDEVYTVGDGGVVTAAFTLSVGVGPVGLTTAWVHETVRREDDPIRGSVADVRELTAPDTPVGAGPGRVVSDLATRLPAGPSGLVTRAAGAADGP
ncbi:hypothetical protein WHI96_12075 [Pseudonocardia tropica]|uniref:Uncharacterized protein n=1 Tax=Pseudonocardia tropica TaxID=681289 RepID=A0ABV1JVH0_9PSEU